MKARYQIGDTQIKKNGLEYIKTEYGWRRNINRKSIYTGNEPKLLLNNYLKKEMKHGIDLYNLPEEVFKAAHSSMEMKSWFVHRIKFTGLVRRPDIYRLDKISGYLYRVDFQYAKDLAEDPEYAGKVKFFKNSEGEYRWIAYQGEETGIYWCKDNDALYDLCIYSGYRKSDEGWVKTAWSFEQYYPTTTNAYLPDVVEAEIYKVNPLNGWQYEGEYDD